MDLSHNKEWNSLFLHDFKFAFESLRQKLTVPHLRLWPRNIIRIIASINYERQFLTTNYMPFWPGLLSSGSDDFGSKVDFLRGDSVSCPIILKTPVIVWSVITEVNIILTLQDLFFENLVNFFFFLMTNFTPEAHMSISRRFPLATNLTGSLCC